jgi:thiosulfate dehydrogenase
MGKRVGQRGDAQGYTFPPLWGPDSFNNGAGMNRLLTTTTLHPPEHAARCQPHGHGIERRRGLRRDGVCLSKPRPLKAHLEADFPARWNKPIDAAFPPYMLGAPADQHRYGPFPPLAEKQREMADSARPTWRRASRLRQQRHQRVDPTARSPRA